MNELSPCPFCGPNMIEHLKIVDSKEGPSKVVKCWACGAIGPYGASNNEMAVEFWNTRTIVHLKTSTNSTNVYEREQ